NRVAPAGRSEPATSRKRQTRKLSGSTMLRFSLPTGNPQGSVKRSESAVVAESCGMRRSKRGPEHEFVGGGRHWIRTSGLVHVKHFRLSAVLGAWQNRAKPPQLCGHGTRCREGSGGRH